MKRVIAANLDCVKQEVRITGYDEKYGGVSEWISGQLSLDHSFKFLGLITINSAAIYIPGPMDYGIYHLSMFHNNYWEL